MRCILHLFLFIALICYPYVESRGYFDHSESDSYDSVEYFDKDDDFGADSNEKEEYFYKEKHFGPDQPHHNIPNYNKYGHYWPGHQNPVIVKKEQNLNKEQPDRHYLPAKDTKEIGYGNGLPHFGSPAYKPPMSMMEYGQYPGNYNHHKQNNFGQNGPYNFDQQRQNKCNYHEKYQFGHEGPMHFGYHGHSNQFGNHRPMNQESYGTPIIQFGRPLPSPSSSGQNFNQFGQNINRVDKTTQHPLSTILNTLFSGFNPSTPAPKPSPSPQPTASVRGPSTPTPLAVLTCIRSCPVTSEYNPVCGSNNITYNNLGRLECAQNCGAAVTLQRASSCNVLPTQAVTVDPTNQITSRPTISPAFETKPTRFTTIDWASRPGIQTERPDPGTIAPDVISSIFNPPIPSTVNPLVPSNPLATGNSTDYDGDIDIRFEG